MRKKKVKKKVEKVTTSIRLTEAQRNRIYKKFDTIQEFINEAYKVQFSKRKAAGKYKNQKV